MKKKLLVKSGCFAGREIPQDHRKGLCICDLCIDQLEAWCDGREGGYLTQCTEKHLRAGHDWDWVKAIRRRQYRLQYNELVTKKKDAAFIYDLVE